MNVLAIAPHPDDLDFGCSGTIAKLADSGHVVEEVIVTDGSKGNKPGISQTELVKKRKKEQRRAAETLGVKQVRFLDEIDGEVKNTKSVRKKIVREIRRFRPDVVMSMDPSGPQFQNRFRSHRDHREVSVAVFDAVSPAAKNAAYFPDLKKEGYEPHHVDEVWFFGTRDPDKFVDITDFFEYKFQALKCHKSQQLDEDRVERTLLDWAREHADEVDGKYAEFFRVLPV